MGIERFFSSIEQNNITNLKSNFTYKLQKQLDSDYLLIDFNSIIHITSSLVLSDMNYLLYQIINKSFKGNNKFKDIIETYNISSTVINVDENLEYKQLINYLTLDNLNKIIFNKVEEYVINILTNFINPTKLQYFYIAVDGVPNKSKMIEQKKRRFMGVIINELKHKIFNKYENELMNEKNRYLYETNKIEWSKIYISPGTKFMNNLNEYLSGNEFNNKIKIICKNLKKYEYSGTNTFGEGEKKIVDYAHNNNINGKISIYSPDSDMSLLCLLLSNKFKNINILRHNQQENNYDIIDVDLLRKNIFQYVSNSMKISTKNIDIKLDEISVINDIVFILTIFGNDFLPKIESFNVKYDFNRIIDKYVKILYDKTITYLLNEKSIDQNMLLKLFKILHDDEGGNLQKIYMTSHYQNYEKLKKIMETDHENFTNTLNNFLSKLKKFNNEIRNEQININNWISDNGEFISKLIKLTKFQTDIQNTINQYEFIDDYIKYYKKYNKFPEVRITFRRYSKSLKNQHYKINLEKSLDKIDPKLKITKYDEEIFKLDNMLDEYAKKLNASLLDLGYVSIDPKTYVWKSEKIEKGVQRYYYEFFGINDINIKNPEMNKLLHEYIEGLLWVFNYYYDIDKNSNNMPDIWYYRYTHAPLITQLYYFLKNQNGNYINKTMDNLHKYKVKLDRFFKPQEHLMYVSPFNSYKDIIPSQYNQTKNMINTINTNKIVEEIWNNNVSDEIDCRGVLFLNKCHINEIHTNDDIFKSWENDIKFIKLLN